MGKRIFLNILLILSLVLIVSCTEDKNNKDTYFGGKIINPKSNHVILFSMGKVIDTFFLNGKNNFLGKIKNANEGLYYFTHGTENQYIYIEESDSLMLRLNTWDFDESLVYAGKGAERNNILLDCFLEDEKSNRFFYELNTQKPAIFKQKVDSLLNLKNATYQNYLENHPEETIGFKSLLKTALTYPLFTRIERYPTQYVYQTKSKVFPKIESTFYSHRNVINTNNDSLMYYYPYSKFIRSYLYNLTYSLGHLPMTNEYSSDFTVDLLKTIDKKINAKDSKNAFLKQTVIGHFYTKSSCNVNKAAFDTFFKLSSNKEDKTRIQKLLKDNDYIKRGEPLEDFIITNLANGKVSVKEVIKKKNTLLLFWSLEHYSKSYISSRVNFLSKKFPEVEFILIKFGENTPDRIRNIDIKTQFYVDSNSAANNFLTSKMSRTILVNSKGIVKNGYASISSKNIYQQLRNLKK
ncbi:hypothetical protein MC378_04115 [Polaribacter sp. MSW13]|uniref:Thioredoxin domain-containing protein n=1 Tax=Polaribacter marinus TaxID=2916838 RepID=A0A9X2AIR2_9FLAO|nr:hypothetical protein [Polaribacter marinus]MCI2228342.1 hypothetical protein [Polaribacter marinus]